MQLRELPSPFPSRLRKNSEYSRFRGRAALQGRVKHMESIRASAPVVVFSVLTDFFRSLLGDFCHVGRLGPFLALHNFELHLVALLKAFIAFAGD